MQIPTEWYIHIVPGLILLVSVLPLIPIQSIFGWRDQYSGSIKDLLGTSIILGIVAFILGFIGNAIGLAILKPGLTWIGLLEPPPPASSISAEQWFWLISNGKLDLAHEISTGYQQMVFLRSLFGTFLVLTVTSIAGCFWRKDYLRYRITGTIILILSTWGVYNQWFIHRASVYEFQIMVLRSLGY